MFDAIYAMRDPIKNNDNDDINYDKWCFFRFRSEGKMTSMCYGLMRNELLDIKEFIDDLKETIALK